MEQQLNFRIVQTWDDKAQFIDDKITITIEHFSNRDGKHQIANPKAAHAQFMSSGKLYMVTNTNGFPTVEDWYLEELLPKMQMLNLLESPIIA